MPVKEFKKYQSLAKIVQDTFGKLKPVSNNSSTQSVKINLIDDTMMMVTYITVINFGSDSALREIMLRTKKDALTIVDATLDTVKEKYKEETDKSVTLKVKQETIRDSVEYVSYSMYSPKKTAFYRLNCEVSIK